jgi:hypothetical protein
MKVRELIAELQKLPEYADVRVLKNEGFYYRGRVDEIVLQPFDEEDEYLDRYVDIK